MSQTSFYRAFEDRYRGSRDTIKDRLRAYARFTAPLLELASPPVALDLGCGRGEWLELLGENGFDARGVDLDDGMLAACRERGLNAVHGDALAALRAQPDASLVLVSSFHLVEHLPFALVQELIAESLRVLRPGGLLIMETPNPENLTVGATSFYRDPTHLHPLPPDLLGFAAEHAGFGRQRIVRLQEDPRLHTDAPVGVITVLEGVSPDYAVVAQKAADAAVLAPFDAAFDAAWGITLGELAQRYEAQEAGRNAEIHHILGRVEDRAGRLEHTVSTGLADVRAQHDLHANSFAGELAAERERASAYAAAVQAQLAELHHLVGGTREQIDALHQHIAQQDARLVHVEAHAAEMAQRVVDLLNSTSWRITEPLRRATAIAYRLRNAQREGRLGSAAKSRAVRLVKRAGRAVLRRPALKRAARTVLRKVPALEARLYALMMENRDSATVAVVLEEAPGELSPRAARAYRQLKQEQARMADAHRH